MGAFSTAYLDGLSAPTDCILREWPDAFFRHISGLPLGLEFTSDDSMPGAKPKRRGFEADDRSHNGFTIGRADRIDRKRWTRFANDAHAHSSLIKRTFAGLLRALTTRRRRCT